MLRIGPRAACVLLVLVLVITASLVTRRMATRNGAPAVPSRYDLESSEFHGVAKIVAVPLAARTRRREGSAASTDPLRNRTLRYAAEMRKRCVAGAAPTSYGQRCCVLAHADSGNEVDGLKRCLPSALIVAAQKSGTTALVAYLSLHPQFTPSKKKEQHFFDLDKNYKRGMLPRYVAKLPAAANARAFVTGEATPSYIAAPYSCRRIAALLPSTRLVAILRDPVERLWSEHLMKVRRIEAQTEFITLLNTHAAELRACMETHLDAERPLRSRAEINAEADAVAACCPAELVAHRFGWPRLRGRFITKAGGTKLPDWRACFADSEEPDAEGLGAPQLGVLSAAAGGAPVHPQENALDFKACNVKLLRETLPDIVAITRQEIARLEPCLARERERGSNEGAAATAGATDATDATGVWRRYTYARGAMERCYPSNTTMISSISKNFVWRGLYALHLENCLEHIDPERMLLIHDRGLLTHPRQTMQRVHAHIGLPSFDGGALSKAELRDVVQRLYPNFASTTQWSIAGSRKHSRPPLELVKLLKAFYAAHDEHLFALLGRRWW